MSTWQERHIEDAERMITYARSQMPGQIGAVPLAMTTEIDEIPLEMLGERPVMYPDDRHRSYEDDFNVLAALHVEAGLLTQESADIAMANFHDFMRASQMRPAQTAPRYY